MLILNKKNGIKASNVFLYTASTGAELVDPMILGARLFFRTLFNKLKPEIEIEVYINRLFMTKGINKMNKIGEVFTIDKIIYLNFGVLKLIKIAPNGIEIMYKRPSILTSGNKLNGIKDKMRYLMFFSFMKDNIRYIDNHKKKVNRNSL